MQVDHELSLARDIQQGLLPPEPLDVPGFRVAGVAVASSEVGGDYYDFSGTAERAWLAIGDVAGHGLSAALLMASMRTAVRLLLDTDTDPADVAARLDRVLLLESLPSQFVSAVLCVVDLRTGTLRYCNAGHHPPLHLSTDGTAELIGGGRPLGILAGSEYRSREVTLAPGDVVVFYTDGLVEEPGRDGEEFGIGRLEESVREVFDASPDEMIEHTRRKMQSHKGRRRSNRDDVTLMIARRAPV
jgi:sigma-B regulation protein RsbU (phosphoserine phosphatase)